MKRVNKQQSVMELNKFEKLHKEAIEWETEYLISSGEFKEEEYDQAYDVAIENVAQDMNITLL
jgi:hypothetical protein